MSNDKVPIKITIPDGSPDEQIKMIDDMMQVFETFAKLTGEEADTKPFLDAIEEIKENQRKEQ
jgi:hypothetical protein